MGLDRQVATTMAVEVAAPVEVVTLNDLRTVSGAAVTVRCERVDELLYLRAMGLPGLSASEEDLRKLMAAHGDEAEAKMRAAMPVMIEAGTAFVAGDGTVHRPAFSWSTDVINGSVPGRYLSFADASLLFATILRLSRFTSAEAEALSFRLRDGSSGGADVGAVAVQQGDGTDAAASPA